MFYFCNYPDTAVFGHQMGLSTPGNSHPLQFWAQDPNLATSFLSSGYIKFKSWCPDENLHILWQQHSQSMCKISSEQSTYCSKWNPRFVWEWDYSSWVYSRTVPQVPDNWQLTDKVPLGKDEKVPKSTQLIKTNFIVFAVKDIYCIVMSLTFPCVKSFNSLRQSDVHNMYIEKKKKKSRSWLIQIMACHLFGTKLLSKPVLHC